MPGSRLVPFSPSIVPGRCTASLVIVSCHWLSVELDEATATLDPLLGILEHEEDVEVVLGRLGPMPVA